MQCPRECGQDLQRVQPDEAGDAKIAMSPKTAESNGDAVWKWLLVTRGTCRLINASSPSSAVPVFDSDQPTQPRMIVEATE
jgi:hypothetical protein